MTPGVVRIALQDSRNNDANCVLLNNDSFVGCNGDFDSYVFSEARSVCSCSGGWSPGCCADGGDLGCGWYGCRRPSCDAP